MANRESGPGAGGYRPASDGEEQEWEHTLAGVRPGASPRLPIEIEVVRDTTGHAAADQAQLAQSWRMYEIWTSNRIYGLNRDLVCIEVLQRPHNASDAQHPLVGARLACGQRQYRSSVHVAYPLPVPGTTAAFVRPPPPGAPKGRAPATSVTSKVERVVLRVLVSSVPLGERAESEVTSAFLKFPKR